MGVIKNYFMEGKARKQVLRFDGSTLDQKIKIQGTTFDRKRKLNKKQLENLQFDIIEGMSVREASEKYKVSGWVVRYNTDSEFKAHQLKLRKGKSKTHTNTMDALNRINYKRYLIKKRKIKVMGIV